MKRRTDEFYVFTVGGDWDEVAEGLRAMGCSIGERKREDSPVTIRYSELALNYFRSLAVGSDKICSFPLPFDHPLWYPKLSSRKTVG